MGMIRVSPAAAAILHERAAHEGRTVVSVVDRLLGLGELPIPVRPETSVGIVPPKQRQPQYVQVSSGSRVGDVCTRCGHETRKHSPACYVAGCHCRRAS